MESKNRISASFDGIFNSVNNSRRFILVVSSFEKVGISPSQILDSLWICVIGLPDTLVSDRSQYISSHALQIAKLMEFFNIVHASRTSKSKGTPYKIWSPKNWKSVSFFSRTDRGKLVHTSLFLWELKNKTIFIRTCFSAIGNCSPFQIPSTIIFEIKFSAWRKITSYSRISMYRSPESVLSKTNFEFSLSQNLVLIETTWTPCSWNTYVTRSFSFFLSMQKENQNDDTSSYNILLKSQKLKKESIYYVPFFLTFWFQTNSDHSTIALSTQSSNGHLVNLNFSPKLFPYLDHTGIII